MNTPTTTQKYDLNNSYCKFGSQILLDLLQGFKDNISGVIRNEDIECIHKIRVASRKLRAALPLFQLCFPDKEFNKWIKELKKVTKLLGEARDLDVQILFINDYKKKVTEKRYIDILLKDHKNRRKNLQATIAKGLDNFKNTNTIEEIASFCIKTIGQTSDETFGPNIVIEKGHWQISFSLEEFLRFQEFVNKLNKNEEHHEMRIAAKKLRYTMEFFAPLYKDKLNQEIEIVKKYQDTLGEKHDCEIWIDYIPKFIEKKKSNRKLKFDERKFEQSLNKFSTYIKEKRKQQYIKFVDLWNENQKSNFFNILVEKSKGGLTLNQQKLQETSLIIKSIGVIADIHGNLHALQRIFEDGEKRGINVFINAGDSIGYGAYPNEVIELLCEKYVISIIGNYDLEVLEDKANNKGEKKIALKFAQKELTKTSKSYLNSLPRELHLEAFGKRIFVTHGSPESIDEHIYQDTSNERLKSLANTAQADIIIVGHSHQQFYKTANGSCFINPGSVGRPGDGNPNTAYAILNFDPFKVELIRLDYDVKRAAEALRRKLLPESFAQMLLRGVALDKIIEEDESKKECLVKDCGKAVSASEDFAKMNWPDTKHYMQVARIALKFYDGLAALHKLGNRERCYLECASILHDIGLSKTNIGHHKKTLQLIENDTQLPFSSEDRRIIANISRYHRKGLPKKSHYSLAGLDNKTALKTKTLASFLRVADGLDYTHESHAENLDFKIGKRRIIVECFSKEKSMLEEQVFNRKKDLFEEVFNRKLVLKWRQA
jgi:putative phosphoesterase